MKGKRGLDNRGVNAAKRFEAWEALTFLETFGVFGRSPFALRF